MYLKKKSKINAPNTKLIKYKKKLHGFIKGLFVPQM